MARPRHPDKDIEAAVAEAERAGWVFVKGYNHCWGRLMCPQANRDGCRLSIWSTPRNPFAHARDIRRAIQRCDHRQDKAP